MDHLLDIRHIYKKQGGWSFQVSLQSFEMIVGMDTMRKRIPLAVNIHFV